MKTQIEIDPKLNKFLIKHKAKRKFMQNAKNDSFSESCVLHSIGEAFVWSETPEGHLFWKKLQSKFIK